MLCSDTIILLKKFDNTSKDINIDELRNRSMLSSTNHFKKLSTHFKLLFIPYIDRMEAQSKDLSWTNQTEQENFQLSYKPFRKKILNSWTEANTY